MRQSPFGAMIGVLACCLALTSAAFARDISQLEHGFPLAEVEDPRFAELFREDQRDRFEGIPLEEMQARDADRREQMAALLLENPDMGAAEWFIAAIIFQHGVTTSDYLLAWQLAKQGHERTGHQSLAWMSAATTDRARLSLGHDQTYGTQFRCIDGRFEPRAIRDRESLDTRRAELGLEPFAEYAATSQREICTASEAE